MAIEIDPNLLNIEETNDPYLVHVVYAGHFRIMQARVEPPIPEWHRRQIFEGALSLLTYQIERMTAHQRLKFVEGLTRCGD